MFPHLPWLKAESASVIEGLQCSGVITREIGGRESDEVDPGNPDRPGMPGRM